MTKKLRGLSRKECDALLRKAFDNFAKSAKAKAAESKAQGETVKPIVLLRGSVLVEHYVTMHMFVQDYLEGRIDLPTFEKELQSVVEVIEAVVESESENKKYSPDNYPIVRIG